VSAGPYPRSALEDGPRPALSAVRWRLGLVLSLFVLAGVGWWWTTAQMRGMDAGPWTDLGGFGWFVLVWLVMMAAMMFPSLAPTVALHARMTSERAPLAPPMFTAGYLVTWTAAGAAAWVVAAGARSVLGDSLSWDQGGRALAAAALILAGAYQLSPLKNVCLSKCRSPLGFLLGSWRDGPLGGLRMGVKLGGWCLGCCWALMLALFALGIMSIAWMALIAGLIAIEKILPWRLAATYGTALVLTALGLLVLLDPTLVPWLTIPTGQVMVM
jgi:predicted metal-binding membrane protein